MKVFNRIIIRLDTKFKSHEFIKCRVRCWYWCWCATNIVGYECMKVTTLLVERFESITFKRSTDKYVVSFKMYPVLSFPTKSTTTYKKEKKKKTREKIVEINDKIHTLHSFRFWQGALWEFHSSHQKMNRQMCQTISQLKITK